MPAPHGAACGIGQGRPRATPQSVGAVQTLSEVRVFCRHGVQILGRVIVHLTYVGKRKLEQR